MNVSYDRFFNPFPLVRICAHLEYALFCVRDFINLILSSSTLTLHVCNSFLLLFYLISSKIDPFVSDTDHFLASHSASSGLPRNAFLLIWAQTVSYFTFHNRWRSLALQCRAILGELLRWLLRFLQKFYSIPKILFD